MENFFYGNPNPSPMMLNPYPQATAPVMNNLLSDAERKLIATEGSGLNIGRSPVDQARAKCTHKNAHGLCIYPRPDNSGLWECSECHKVFNIVDYSQQEVEDLCMKMSDVIENVKAFIPFISGETGVPVYQALDLAVDTLPKLYAYMLEQKHNLMNAYNNLNQTMQPNGMSTINQLYSLTNPANPIGGFYGNAYAQPMMQPGMYQQPQMMLQQQMVQNPYQQPQQQVMPQQQPMMQPGMYQQPQMMPQQQMVQNPYQQPMMQPGMYQQPNDRPVGVVEPQQMVQQQQVAVSGPAPMAQTAANVPPAQTANTQNVKKSFKA